MTAPRPAAGLASLVTALWLAGCGSTSAPAVRPARPPAIAPAASAPPPWRFETLDGGLVAAIATEPSDAFGALLWFPSGAEDEPPALPGLRGFMAHAATMGAVGDPDRATGPHRRALLAGGELRVVETGDGVGWLVTGPPDAAPTLLQLLLDVVARPTFSPTRVQAAAELRRESLDLARDPHIARAAAWAAGLALDRGVPTARWATTDTLASLNREDLVRAHQRIVRPERAALVVIGADRQRVSRAAAGWVAPPPAPAVQQPVCRPSPPATQAFLAAPPAERAVIVALEVPPRTRAARLTLDALLAEQLADAVDDDVEAVIADLGARSVLLVSSRGAPDAAADRVDAWFRRLAGPDLDTRAALGRALLGAPHPLTRAGLVDAARAARHLLPDADAANGAAVLARVRDLLRDTDARIRVGAGPDDVREALARWGPTIVLDGAASACAP